MAKDTELDNLDLDLDLELDDSDLDFDAGFESEATADSTEGDDFGELDLGGDAADKSGLG